MTEVHKVASSTLSKIASVVFHIVHCALQGLHDSMGKIHFFLEMRVGVEESGKRSQYEGVAKK